MFLLFGLLLPFLGTQATVCLFIFAIAGYIYYKVQKKYSYWKKKGINYVRPKFLLGNMEIIRSRSLSEQVQWLYNFYPEERYHGIYSFLNPLLLIKDPDLIKQITVKDFDYFLNHRLVATADGGDPFWSKNLLGSRDERWRDMRSTLSPSFTGSKMKIMYTLMEECAQQFVDHFKKENQKIIELDVKDALRKYTCNVIGTTAFGIKCNTLEKKDSEFYTMGKNATNFSGLRLFRFMAYIICPTLATWFKIKMTPPAITDYFSKIIEDTIKTRKEKNIVRPDMIHLLLEAQKQGEKEISSLDISSQAFIFFFAGFESVSNILTFILYELALNPEIQNRLRNEIQSVESLNYENLQGLKYLDMVVSETLRKWPPFPISDREVSKDFTIEAVRPGEKPLFLEKGVVCWMPIFPLHRDPKFYPDPEKFDPERFNDENKHKIKIYVPFGMGPRNCIGARFATLESKLIVAHILKNFEIVTVDRTQNPVPLDKYSINVTPQDGLWLGLKKIT